MIRDKTPAATIETSISHPEFKEAFLIYRSSGHSYWYTDLDNNFDFYGKSGMDDEVVLIRKVGTKTMTLNDVKDGDIFTCATKLLTWPVGTKFMRYYNHLVVLGYPSISGASDFFITQQHSIHVQKITI